MSEYIENSGDTLIAQKNKNTTISSAVKYREDGCLQPPLPSISLTDEHEIINLDGYQVSVGDLKEHVIDSYMYRKHLKALMKEAQKERR